MALTEVLPRLASYAKRDASFTPVKNTSSERWHVVANGEFELVVTGPKFWDVRGNVGGGGAIDLAVHIWGCSYRAAIRRLGNLQL